MYNYFRHFSRIWKKQGNISSAPLKLVALKLPYTVAQQEQIGDIAVRRFDRAERFMGHLYVVLVAYSVGTMVWAVILMVLFILKAMDCLPGISWETFGKYFFTTGGLGVATWFFKPVRDQLIKQSSSVS